MSSESPAKRLNSGGLVPNPSNHERPLLTHLERNSQLVRQHGGLISVPGKLKPPVSGASRRLTKLLLNITVQPSFGPVQVVTSPENTVGDLIKETLAIYVKEKRRPLVKQTNPEFYELHYSQFSLESKSYISITESTPLFWNFSILNFHLFFYLTVSSYTASCRESAFIQEMATRHLQSEK